MRKLRVLMAVVLGLALEFAGLTSDDEVIR